MPLTKHPGVICVGKPIDARSLASRLRPYGIRPKNVRIGGQVPKGYDRADLHDAWIRYLSEPAMAHATSATSATQRSEVANVAGVADNYAGEPGLPGGGFKSFAKDSGTRLATSVLIGAHQHFRTSMPQPRKSTAHHKLIGNYRPSRHQQRPADTAGIGAAPERLEIELRPVWVELAGGLPFGVGGEHDRVAFELAAHGGPHALRQAERG